MLSRKVLDMFSNLIDRVSLKSSFCLYSLYLHQAIHEKVIFQIIIVKVEHFPNFCSIKMWKQKVDIKPKNDHGC